MVTEPPGLAPPAPPGPDHRQRRERLRELLDERGVGALLVTHLVDVRWLTGLVASNAAVLVVAGEPDADRLFTDGRYAERAEACDVAVDLEPWTAHLAGAALPGPVGFQAEHLVVRTHERLAEALGRPPVATTGLLADLRRVKDAHEMAAVERACRITDEGWQWLLGAVRPGLSEADLARDLVRHLEDLGAEGPAFAPIVAGGPNSAVPHHAPTDRPLRVGEVLKVDFGARVDGYCSDCTRVLALGDPGPRLREVHRLVAAAQADGVAAAVAGATAADVHDAAVGALEAAGAGPTIHGVGHGLGLEIHEAPILSSEPTATLGDGFVITVEPGIYLTGIGGVRIEDTVAVTASGPRRLTTSSRDLVVL